MLKFKNHLKELNFAALLAPSPTYRASSKQVRNMIQLVAFMGYVEGG